MTKNIVKNYIINVKKAKILYIESFWCTIGSKTLSNSTYPLSTGSCLIASDVFQREIKYSKIIDCFSQKLSFGLEFIDSFDFNENVQKYENFSSFNVRNYFIYLNYLI